MSGSPVYALAIGVCAGAALALWGFNAPLLAGGALLAATAAVFVKRSPAAFIVALGLAALALGLVRTELLVAHEAARSIAVAGPALVEGVVASDPERRQATLHAQVEVSSINGRPSRGKLLAFLPREESLAYNDRVVFRGTLAPPESFATETGRIFDYPNYLRVRGVSATLQFVEVIERAPQFSFLGALFSLKHSFTRTLEELFVEPQGSLLLGLLLGERRGLPDELTSAFIAAGLIHVVVLSGYNISIIAEGVLRALSWLPKLVGFGLGGITIALFVVMIGAGATAVRALIMGLIAIVARYFGRSMVALRALALAAGAMVLWNPLVVLYDPSFILSVVATFGLVTLSPFFEARMPAFFNRAVQLRSIAASTVAVQVFVLPALLYMSGIVSPWALPANLLVLPVVPFAMGLGFLATLLGALHPVLTLPVLLIADALLRYMSAVAVAVEHLPLASSVVAAFPLWVVMLAYVPLIAFAMRHYLKNASPSRPN